MTQSSKDRTRTSYHVHSTWSDGTDTVAALVRAAEEQNLLELGISDHFILPNNGVGPFDWSLGPHSLEPYVLEVREARHIAPLPVRLSVEVDFFPDRVPELRELLSPHRFDYLIGSVHFVDGFPLDESGRYWEPLKQQEVDDVCRAYWIRVAEMASTGLFQLAGHLDLFKKFAVRAGIDLRPEIGRALDAIQAAGMAVELNTSGWDKPCQDAYPEQGILREAISRKIPIVVTADAHRARDLTNHFDRAYELLAGLGVTQAARLSRKAQSAKPGLFA